MDPTTVFERMRASSASEVERLLVDILQSRQASALHDALNGIVRQAAQWLAQDRVDMFLSLGHHLDVALRRCRFPQEWKDAEIDDMVPLLWQLTGMSRICHATLQIRIAPEKYGYLIHNALALPLLRFLATGAKRHTDIRRFLGEHTGKEANPNTARQVLTKLSELDLIRQPHKRGPYDITFLGRQQLRLFEANQSNAADTAAAPPTGWEAGCDWLAKLEQLGPSLLSPETISLTKCDVWLTSWPQDAYGWTVDASLFPQKRLRFLILGDEPYANKLANKLVQCLPSDECGATKTFHADIQYLDAGRSELTQVAENGHYCRLVSKDGEGLAFGSERIRAIEWVTHQPLACRETLLHANGRLGVELDFVTSPPLTHGQSMSWVKKQYEVAWKQAKPISCARV